MKRKIERSFVIAVVEWAVVTKLFRLTGNYAVKFVFLTFADGGNSEGTSQKIRRCVILLIGYPNQKVKKLPVFA